jgi:hypothetical protein
MPPPPGRPEPIPLWAGVEERRQPGLGDDLVERVGGAVVGEEALEVGVELEAAYAVLVDEPARRARAVAPAGGVDAGERDHHVRVGGSDLGDLLVGHRRAAGLRLPVDREDDAGHAALAIVPGDVVGGRLRVVTAEVRLRCGAQLGRHRIVAGARDLRVDVDVDRADGVDVDSHQGIVTGAIVTGLCSR